MAIVAAAFAVYWLIVGAVWLLGAIARYVVKQPKAQPAAAPTHAVVPTIEAPPSLDYEAITQIEPLPRSDDKATGDSIRRTFAIWARQLPRVPSDSSLIVRKLHIHEHLLVRRDSVIEGRKLSWRSSPTREPTRGNPDAVDPRTIDPWLPTSELLATTTHVAPCKPCSGTGSVKCQACWGSEIVSCPNCNGAGKAYGIASNGSRRLMNCRTCDKKGEITCPSCSRGHVACADCDGAARIKWWLESESWKRSDVQVDPDDYARVFGWSKDGQHATSDEIESDAWVAGMAKGEGPIPPSKAPSEIPRAERDRMLAAVEPQLHAGERVVRQTLRALEIPAVAVTYGTSNGEQTIEFMGRRLLAPRRFVDTVMHERARFLGWMMALLMLMPLGVGLAYLARGEYYASPEVGAMVAAVSLAAALLYRTLQLATLGRRSGLVWLGAAAAPLAATVALGFLAEPDIADAKKYVREGRIEEAREELAALGGADDPELAPVYADVHLAQVRGATSAEEASEHLSLIPAELPQRAVAQAIVDALWIAEADAALKRGDPTKAKTHLANASEAARQSAEATAIIAAASLMAGQRCLADKDYECAYEHGGTASNHGNSDGAVLRSETLAALRVDANEAIGWANTTKPLEPRVEALRRAVGRLELLGRLSNAEAAEPSTELSKLRSRLEKDEAALAKQRAEEEARRARQAEKERKAAEKRRRAEELQAQRAAERQKREERRRPASSGYSAPSGRCCKHCSKGKPCGDTCIARNRTCHVGRGCAC